MSFLALDDGQGRLFPSTISSSLTLYIFHYCVTVSYDLWCRVFRFVKYLGCCDQNRGEL